MATTWDLTHVMPDGSAKGVDAELAQGRQAVDKFCQTWDQVTPDQLSEIPTLRKFLDDYEELSRYPGTSGHAGLYFFLATALDQGDPELKARNNLVEKQETELAARLAFVHVRLSLIPEQKWESITSAPEMQKYKHYLELTFAEAKHTLSEDQEKIMTMLQSVGKRNWVKMVNELNGDQSAEIELADGTVVEKTFQELISLCSDSDAGVRVRAATAVNKFVADIAPVAEHEMNSVMQFKQIDDDLRKYSRPDESRHIYDDIDSEVVDALIEAVVSQNHLSHEFYKFKAELLGMEKLNYAERNLNWKQSEEKITYEQAMQITSESLHKVKPEWAERLNQMSDAGRIDVFPKVGKLGGAFCMHNMISEPEYILLNFTERLRDVSTLAHEFGHALNFQLINESAHALDANTSMSTAEVASTCFEELVFADLLETLPESEQLPLIIEKLNDQVSTIFRQIAAYRFERAIHDRFRTQGYVGREEMGKLFAEHMQAYLGDSVVFETPHHNWWVYWSHFRTYFYVYSYVSGLLIAKALARKLKVESDFIPKYEDFLRAGRNASPKELFSKMGIDIANPEFWRAGVAEFATELERAKALARSQGLIK